MNLYLTTKRADCLTEVGESQWQRDWGEKGREARVSKQREHLTYAVSRNT